MFKITATLTAPSDEAGGVSDHACVIRHIFTDQRASTNHGKLTNGDTTHNGGVGTNDGFVKTQ